MHELRLLYIKAIESALEDGAFSVKRKVKNLRCPLSEASDKELSHICSACHLSLKTAEQIEKEAKEEAERLEKMGVALPACISINTSSNSYDVDEPAHGFFGRIEEAICEN